VPLSRFTSPPRGGRSKNVEHDIVLFNGELGRFCVLHMTIDFHTNGLADIHTFISSASGTYEEPMWKRIISWIFNIYILVMFFEECRELRSYGFAAYCADLTNVMDLAMICICIAVFIIRQKEHMIVGLLKYPEHPEMLHGSVRVESHEFVKARDYLIYEVKQA
jgi:hypothetical protein